jgi:hypothetical protein
MRTDRYNEANSRLSQFYEIATTKKVSKKEQATDILKPKTLF